MKNIQYTNGVDVISILHKEKNGFLVSDSHSNTIFLENLNGYRNLSDKRSIKEWYKDSKVYASKHPLNALISVMSVFFGLTSF